MRSMVVGVVSVLTTQCSFCRVIGKIKPCEEESGGERREALAGRIAEMAQQLMPRWLIGYGDRGGGIELAGDEGLERVAELIECLDEPVSSVSQSREEALERQQR